MTLRLFINTLLREPLLGFALAGGLIFVLYAYTVKPGLSTDQIVVTQQQIDAITQERELVLGRPLQSQERESLVQRFIDEEVMVREAYTLGLDRVDGRVRSQLIKKMTFLIEEEPSQPTEADLLALETADPERYRKPAMLGLRLVSIENEHTDANALLRGLRNGSLTVQDVGDDRSIEQVTVQEVAMTLGLEQAEGFLEQEAGEWSGPYSLPQGHVLVQLTSSEPAHEYPDELLDKYLREDWAIARRQEIYQQKIAALRQGYRISIQLATEGLQAAEH